MQTCKPLARIHIPLAGTLHKGRTPFLEDPRAKRTFALRPPVLRRTDRTPSAAAPSSASSAAAARSGSARPAQGEALRVRPSPFGRPLPCGPLPCGPLPCDPSEAFPPGPSPLDRGEAPSSRATAEVRSAAGRRTCAALMTTGRRLAAAPVIITLTPSDFQLPTPNF